MILDGGNRYQACVSLGIAPIYEEFTGEGIGAFVLTSNLHRRHLTPGQQAAIVACVQDWSKAQLVGKPKSGNLTGLQTVANRTEISGVSEKTQRTADKVAKANPELAKAVGRGEITLPQAEKQAFPKPEISPPQEEHKYTELDAAKDQIDDLKSIIAAGFLNPTEEDRAVAQELVDDMRKEIKSLRATLSATESQRDLLMAENASIKRQCLMQARKLKKYEGEGNVK